MAKFNIEDIETVKRTVEALEEAVITGKKGLEGCDELAHQVGADKYTRTTKSFVEKGENCLKTMEDYIAVGRELIGHYDRMNEHLM
ncbi:hypothetical protein [Paraclostridium bifermentans]|uniref:hypothetical protein n=1 Tax=Paraclostridium bifermentans TaxID=1490 RepID=UPI00374F2F3B